MRRSENAAASRPLRKQTEGGLTGAAGRRLGAWWTAAALLHLVALVLLLERPRPERPHKIDVAPPSQRDIGRAVAEARQKRQAPQKASKPQDKPQAVPPERPKGTIVELAPGERETPRQDARYLAERDSRTDKETSAKAEPKQPPAQAPAAMPSRAPMQPKARARATPPAALRPLSQETKRPPVPKSPDGLRRAEPKRPKAPSDVSGPRVDGPKKRAQPNESVEPTTPRKLTLAQLMPSMGALAQQPGAPAPPIALGAAVPDIEEGGATVLNARAFRHAGYFNRLMRSVEQFWHPAERYQRMDPSGQMYGTQPRLTVLEVTLDGQGHLRDVRVLEPSGIYFLDDEAVAAFRRAEPFNHPPAALIDAQGAIVFSVGFHFHIR